MEADCLFILSFRTPLKGEEGGVSLSFFLSLFFFLSIAVVNINVRKGDIAKILVVIVVVEVFVLVVMIVCNGGGWELFLW